MNAKEELLETLNCCNSKIKCANIKYGDDWDTRQLKFSLRVNYSDKELQEFLAALDFEYDEGYGAQQLFGTVWLENDEWLERNEYDGSEWWEYMKLPEIPEHLKG